MELLLLVYTSELDCVCLFDMIASHQQEYKQNLDRASTLIDSLLADHHQVSFFFSYPYTIAYIIIYSIYS